jgi:SAM-dependent methyltransferase
MGFYEDFIEKYDKLISWENRSERETDFFKSLFNSHRVEKVLDCACGTGQHVVMFNEMGLSATGSDLSPAMIERAKLNAKKRNINARFEIADFRSLSKTFNEKFDAVICVGNSLPHLLNDQDLITALNEINNLLNDGGLFILQQRNYDMLVGQQKRFFPMSIREGEVFFYVLDFFEDKVIFNVIDLEIETKKFDVFSSEYNPIKKSYLEELLVKTGFKNLKFYGDYKFRDFDIEKDEFLTVICEK